MPGILYTVAIDEQGQLIKANDAEKHLAYFCPVCKSQLILRKSGKVGKGSKRPHFAHRTLTPNCTPETALHYSFKNLLAEMIQEHIATETPVDVFWKCTWCGKRHESNLLENISEVKVEHYLTVCKPDIALINRDGKASAVIEVVVTHKPEEKAVEFYKTNDISLIQINVESDKDIDEMFEKLAVPSAVSKCFNPKCETCGDFKETKSMTVIDTFCWKCDSPMKVAYVSCSNGGMIDGASHHYPSNFSPEEKAFAESKGVILKEKYSRTMTEAYVANCCPNCDTFIGEHYLFTEHIVPASYGDLNSEEFPIGYYCEKCEGLPKPY